MTEEILDTEIANELNETASEDTVAENEPKEETSAEAVDYERLVLEDIEALKREFPSLSNLNSITELDNPLRYAALRDLGLTPTEAYLATRKQRPTSDNRSHLSGVPSVSVSGGNVMSERELDAVRELFSDISDIEIRRLYRKVTK